jgi:CHAT domain-containing protein/tetratricopeptide (TPR) repeat protein
VLSPLLLLLAVAVQVGVTGRPGYVPRQAMREARDAIDGDSLDRVRARWQARLAPDSTDREAMLGLATAARLGADDSTAAPLYRRILVLTPTRPDPYGVYATLGLARLAYESIRMEETDSLVSRALAEARALRDRVAEADALQALGNARVDAAKPVGLAYLDSALRILPPSEADFIAAIRCRRALFLFFMGDSRTQEALASALEFARRAKAQRAEAQCLRAAARDLWGRGLEDSSLAMIRRATDILRRIHDRRSLAFALTTMADVLRDHGAYGEAKAALGEALVQARASGYQEAEALAKHMLGTLYYSLHDLPTASRYFDLAMAQYVAMGDSLNQVNVRSWQANIARDRGDLATSRRLTLAALEFDKHSGSTVGTIEMYHSLADIEILAGNWPAAAEALDSSEHTLRRHGIDTWRPKLIYQRGRLALHRGDLDSAEHVFRRYLRDLGPDDHHRQHETRAYLADILARRGDLAGAERELTAAGDALDAWRETLDDQQLRLMAFQATASDESDRNSSVPRVIAALAAGGRTGAAFGLSERRRARELGQRLVEASALEASPAGATSPKALLAGSAVSASIGAPEIAGLLPDDSTALVEYVTGALGAPTTAFLVTRRGPARARVVPPADSLTGAIGRFIALVARGGDARAEATALGRALLEPVLALAGPSVVRLIIVPDGPLHRIPWDALRLGDGRYVVERYAVAIAPSAGALGALWHRRRDASPPDSARLLAFGDPDFTGLTTGDTMQSTVDPIAQAGGLPRLPGSGTEARMVARYAASAEVRLRRRASADYLRHSPLTGFRVIHFATHALVDDRALGRTALALAPDSSGSGLVTPGELAALRLDADMVVLSACRTAGGVVVDGEGIQGLTASLLEAGARSVVATSWRVGDRSTVRFVDRLYAELARGKPVIDALRTAKLESLEAGDPPAVWAAFSVVGDPTVVVPLKVPPSTRLSWAGAGAVAAMAIVVVVARRRRRPSAAG